MPGDRPVITDVRMPGISGVELLERLRSDYPDIVVILVSAFATVANAVEAMKLGAQSLSDTSHLILTNCDW